MHTTGRDGAVEYDGTAPSAKKLATKNHGAALEHGAHKKARRGQKQADGLPSRRRHGAETNTHEAYAARQQKKAEAAAEALQEAAAAAAAAAKAAAADGKGAAVEEDELPRPKQADVAMAQAPTEGRRSARTAAGKRQALAGAQAGHDEAAGVDEAATDEAVAGGAAGPATTTGATVADSPPKDPVRARVMRPGAAKQARAPPRYVTYAAAVLRAGAAADTRLPTGGGDAARLDDGYL